MIVVSRAARRSIGWALLAAFGPAASDTLRTAMRIESTAVAPNVVAQLVIAHQPLDASRDPEQFGTPLIGLCRVTMHGADDAVWEPGSRRHRATQFL
jgi:hypothetical protein